MGKLCGVPEQEAAWLGPDSAPDVQCDHVTASLGAWFPVQTEKSFVSCASGDRLVRRLVDQQGSSRKQAALTHG